MIGRLSVSAFDGTFNIPGWLPVDIGLDSLEEINNLLENCKVMLMVVTLWKLM